jgi:hypothetical protein
VIASTGSLFDRVRLTSTATPSWAPSARRADRPIGDERFRCPFSGDCSR